MIKNIILDMGNVLLDYDPQRPLDQFLSSDEGKQLIRQELFQGPEWILGDLGLMPPKEKFEGVKQRIPQKFWEGLKECVEKWHEFLPPVKGAKTFLNQAKAYGYRLYVLSNASMEFYQYFPKEYDMQMFDGVVVSADLHIIKPDMAIYQYLIDQYQLCPQESLFIDDRVENIEAARRIGIQGDVFESNYEAIAKKHRLFR